MNYSQLGWKSDSEEIDHLKVMQETNRAASSQ